MIRRNICMVGLIGMLLGLGSGCHQPLEHGKHHGQAHMIQHIAEGHGVLIGTNETDDVLVTHSTTNKVTVTFSETVLKRVGPDCLGVLRFSGKCKTMDPVQYDEFLHDFHSYLLASGVFTEESKKHQHGHQHSH